MRRPWLGVAVVAAAVVVAVVVIAAVALTMRGPQRRLVTLAPPAPPTEGSSASSSSSPSRAQGAETKRLLDVTTPRPAGAVDLHVAFAENLPPTTPPPRVRFYLKQPIRPVAGLPAPGELARLGPGLSRVDLSDFPDGDHHLYVVADGHAAQWRRVRIENGQIVHGARHDVTLHPAKFVTVRWAFNVAGKPELTGADVVTGRTALTHFGRLPYFGMDWQLWQVDRPRQSGFGDVPMLEFHRVSPNMGFQAAPDGATFDGLTAAPSDGYEPKSIEATPGLLLLCRVEGNSAKPGDRGYGKIVVESVSTTRPAGVEVREPNYP